MLLHNTKEFLNANVVRQHLRPGICRKVYTLAGQNYKPLICRAQHSLDHFPNYRN